MKDFKDILNSGNSDELLAAYIDGNTTESENALIENTLNGDSMLSEAYEIASDGVSFGSDFDWEPHKGDFGFWELGLPPAVTKEDLLAAYNKAVNNMAERTYGYEPNNELDTFDPNVWQGNQPTCAIRSQEIILRDYGIYHTQDELVEFATNNGWFDPDPENGGTDKYAVGNILDACGIPTTRIDNATIYDIIAELKAGHRVIVSVDADELWVKKEPNLFNRVIAQITNMANDAVQNFLGLEGANHALIVAGVNVNPKDPSDIKVTLIDSGTGDVCIEYSLKDFHNAWSDGHCRMISTNIPAPFQYNYHTHQIEPSNIATDYTPSMVSMPEGLTNQFHLGDSYYDVYEDYQPKYTDDNNIDVNYDNETSSSAEYTKDFDESNDSSYSNDDNEESSTLYSSSGSQEDNSIGSYGCDDGNSDFEPQTNGEDSETNDFNQTEE